MSFPEHSSSSQEAPSSTDGTARVCVLLGQGLSLVEGLLLKLQQLDTLMLTGKPKEISQAAAVLEVDLLGSAPVFAEIASLMGELGVSDFASAAVQLRRVEQEDAANMADALRGALSRFAKRSASAGRKAQGLNRGLAAALRGLQALGLEESGRLIAEA